MSEQYDKALNETFGTPTKKNADARDRLAPVVGELRRIGLITEMRSVDDVNRTIDFVASTESRDRYGDSIKVSGWKTDNYMRNPVFLFQHRSNEPPIGKTIKLWKEANPPALVQRVQFADAKTYPFAETIFRLYQGKFMNATSVGFMPTEEPKRILDENNNWTGGYEFTSQELLELSAVAVPANPEALARSLHRAVDEGVITRDAEREAAKSFLDAFLNPSWSQSIPGVTYAVEEPVTPKKSELNDEHPEEIASSEDLERAVLGVRPHGEIANGDDLERRLFKLS